MNRVYSLLIALVAICVLLGCGTRVGDLPSTVAEVNGQQISADEYVKQLLTAAGQMVLQNMIEQRIIAQWAEEEGVAPTDKQVQQLIEQLKDQGWYDEQVKTHGEDAVLRELRFTQARINLGRKYMKISDDDIKAAYEQMKPNMFVHPSRKFVALMMSTSKDRIEKALKAIKNGDDFDQVARKYSDRNLVPNPPIKTWIPTDSTMKQQPELYKALLSTKVGKTSGVISLSGLGGRTSYGILKVLRAQSARNAKLDDVKEQVKNQAILQNSQFDSDFVKKLNAKMKAAKVKINVEKLENVADIINNPSNPIGMMPGNP